MNIAVICWWDRNSGEDLAKAIGTKYPTTYTQRDNTTWNDYEESLSDADVIVIKGDLHPKRDGGVLKVYHPRNFELPDMCGHRLKAGAKLILVPAGGNFRRKIPGYRKASANRPLSDYVDNCDFIAPMNPDLNYPEINGLYIPMAVDTSKIYNAWDIRSPFKITAYNGTLDAKGVERYLIPAVSNLNKQGSNINLVIGSGVGDTAIPRNIFIEHKKESSLCFGQMAPMGEYGKHELEAMSYGIPTIISYNAQTIKQAYPIEQFGEPLLKANDYSELVAILRGALKGRIDMKAVSENTFKYVKRVHSFETVVGIFDMILERIL